jgi:hypothetical protein
MEKPRLQPASEVLPEERISPLESGELATHMMAINALMKDLDRFTDEDFDKLFRKWPIDAQVKFKDMVEHNLPSEIRLED